MTATAARLLQAKPRKLELPLGLSPEWRTTSLLALFCCLLRCLSRELDQSRAARTGTSTPPQRPDYIAGGSLAHCSTTQIPKSRLQRTREGTERVLTEQATT